MSNITLPTIPTSLIWQYPPATWQIDGHDVLQITAGPKTDLFHDPAGRSKMQNGARLVFVPDPRFTLSAHVAVNFASTFDAGALLVYADDAHWAKLCFEFSPQGKPMIVSVVTDEVSDDCNSVTLDRYDVYLRVSRLGSTFAFHYSRDAHTWHMVRHFALRGSDEVLAGFMAQSPMGAGCTVTFAGIHYTPQGVTDIRSGE